MEGGEEALVCYDPGGDCGEVGFVDDVALEVAEPGCCCGAEDGYIFLVRMIDIVDCAG